MSLSKVVLRLFAPTGRFRIEVSKNDTLLDLHRHVAEKCGYGANPAAVRLFLDPQQSQQLSQSNVIRLAMQPTELRSGQILYVAATEDGSAVASIGRSSANLSSAASPLPDSVSQKSESSASGIGSHPPSEAATAASSVDPKFKSFDKFLDERSFNTLDLPLNTNFRPRPLVRGAPNIIPPSVTLKHQPYRFVDLVVFMNLKEMDNFCRYWRIEHSMLEQRGGWLFGYFVEDSHYPMGIRAVVEAIYEPPQITQDDSVLFLSDPFFSEAKKVADQLNLELVGWIFTHLPREELLTSSEVEQIARLQLANQKNNHYTKYPVTPFVTITLTLSNTGSNEAVINAFMVSDLGMALVRDGLIAHSDNPKRVKLKIAEKHELLPEILESGKQTTEFDPDWLVVRVNDSAPKRIQSRFERWDFPVENRSRQQSPSDIPAYLRKFCKGSASDGHLPNDFHFLLYIAKLFDTATASTVCRSIVDRTELEASLVETLEMIG